jgi:NAD-dependent dihydropyrimidine dehydrogenase PreA subunit
MSYIIGNPCVSVCDTVCVEVCPVDCIHGPIDLNGMGREVEGMSKEELKDKQLFINPSECIDCGACEPECPVNAIYQDEQTAITMEGNDLSVKKNYEFYGLTFES